MDVFEAVRTVLAVRKYQQKRIPPEALRQILESGRLTASSMNLQPWHFVLIEKHETLQALGRMIRTGPFLAQAAAAIAVLVERESIYGVSDGSRAIQSMILTAWNLGIGSNWVGFGDIKEARPMLNVPEHMDILAILSLGYPVEAIGKGKKKRKSFAEVVSREKVGTPLE